MSASFPQILDAFTAAVAAGDGERFAACFTEDGEYDDVFYGIFRGRAAIADMLENHFHRDGREFDWEMLDTVSDGRHAYARWRFSYTSRMTENEGTRVLMEGVGCYILRDGLIERYEDMARTGELMVRLGLPAEKMHRTLSRMARRQEALPGAERHLRRDG